MGLSNGKLSKPISVADIADCLGYASSDVGTLCLSPNINIRAKFKPFSKSVRRAVTETERREADYGHMFNSYSSPAAAMRAVAAGTNFPYIRPTAPYYRMLDFDGYDHYAGDWYPVEPRNTQAEKSGAIIVTVDLSGLFGLGGLGGLRDDDGSAQFGWILSQSPFTTGTTAVYWYPLTSPDGNTIADLTKHDISLTDFDTGVWYMYPAITTAGSYTARHPHYVRDTDPHTGTWWPLPFSNAVQFTVKETIVVDPLDRLVVSWMGNVEDESPFVTLRSFSVSLYNPTDTALPSVQVSVRSINSIPSGVAVGSSRTVSVGAEASATAAVLSSGSVSWEFINGRAQVEVTLDTASKERKVTLNITEK